jgi:hypothetical protein
MYREEFEPTISALEQSKSVRAPGGLATVDSYKILKLLVILLMHRNTIFRNLTDVNASIKPKQERMSVRFGTQVMKSASKRICDYGGPQEYASSSVRQSTEYLRA